MRRKLWVSALVVLPVVAGVAVAAPTLSGTWMTNLAVVTANNTMFVPSASVVVTNQTMYGGAVGVDGPYVKSIAAFQVVSWTISLTNHGNASADFLVRVVQTNMRPGVPAGEPASYGWRWALGSTAFVGVAPGDSVTTTLEITNRQPVTNGSYFSLLLKFSNTSAPFAARVYRSVVGGVWYGGRLGVATNSSGTNGVTTGVEIGPVVYLQHAAQRSGGTNDAGFLTAVVQGPVLVVSKWIQTIDHPASGLGLTGIKVEPGAVITYYINLTNKGSAPASGVVVRDRFNTNFALVDYTNGTGFTYRRTETAGSFTTLVFSNNAFNQGTNDRIRIRVRVK